MSLRACRRPETVTLRLSPRARHPQSWNGNPRVADVFSLGFIFLELLVGRELDPAGKRQMIAALVLGECGERCSADTAKLVADMIRPFACYRPSVESVLARLPPRTLATAPASSTPAATKRARAESTSWAATQMAWTLWLQQTRPRPTTRGHCSTNSRHRRWSGSTRDDLDTLNAIGDDGQGSHHRTRGEGGGTGPDAHAKRGRSVEEAVLRIGGVTCGGSEGVATPSAAKRRRCE